jgi:2-dehydro-3-deoxyphosphogalactonate aldolase
MQSELLSQDDALVAILRGVVPQRVIGVANVLYEAGIRIIEIPLNSPDPFESISALAGGKLPDCLVGAGTVLNTDDVRRTQTAGAGLIVSPNINAEVIAAAARLNMQVLPGVATATEAFAAIAAGATHLKLFPATTYGPKHLQALRTVLPKNVRLFPVGGVAGEHIYDWLSAGAAGFGFGSELFRPQFSLQEIANRAQLLVGAMRAARRRIESIDGAGTTKMTNPGGVT